MKSSAPISIDQKAELSGGLRERGKAMRRARIIAAARNVFQAKGYEAATTREIAVHAEVGTGTLFDYARDKRALLMMVFYEDLERLTDEAFATLPADASILDQLIHMFAPRYAFWGADRTLSRYAMRETFALLARHRDAETHVFQSRRPLFLGKLEQIVRAHQAAGAIAARFPAEDLARLFMGIYLHESREWVQEDNAAIDAGLARLRSMLAIAVTGMLT